MTRTIAAAILLALVASPLTGQEKETRFSLGYAFLQVLEGGVIPVGGYLSVASAGKKLGFAGDVAYHRESDVNLITGGIGPRFSFGSGTTQPFLHVLGGAQYFFGDGESNIKLGGMVGIGVDIPTGSSLFVRLGADFQTFLDGGTLKLLRFVGGVSF